MRIFAKLTQNKKTKKQNKRNERKDSLITIDKEMGTISDQINDFIVCIFGNKSDKTEDREITKNEAYNELIEIKKKYKNIEMFYLGETSALNNENINQFINYGLELCIQKLPKCKCHMFLPTDSSTENESNTFEINQTIMLPPWNVFN